MNAHRFFAFFGIAGFGIAMLAGGSAHAQESGAPQPAAGADASPAAQPAAPQTPAIEAKPEAPVAAPRPALAAAPPAPVLTTCGAGVVRGLPQGESETAVWLICEEVRRYGAAPRPASLPPNAGPVVYRVDLAKLGDSVIVTLAAEAPPGQRVDSRRITVRKLEETAVAAPRLADALMQGRPVQKTQTVSNLLSSETRKPEQKPGQFMVGGGIAGTLLPGTGTPLAPGLDLRATYETDRAGINLGLRFGSGGDYPDGEASYVGLSVGGRYFLTDADITPFVGGGLAWSGIGLSNSDLDKNPAFSGDGSGLGAYGEVGIELMRMHASRLSLDLRVEAPFYSVKEGGYGYSGPMPAYDASGAIETRTEPASHYVVPVSFGLVYTFGK